MMSAIKEAALSTLSLQVRLQEGSPEATSFLFPGRFHHPVFDCLQSRCCTVSKTGLEHVLTAIILLEVVRGKEGKGDAFCALVLHLENNLS